MTDFKNNFGENLNPNSSKVQGGGKDPFLPKGRIYKKKIEGSDKYKYKIEYLEEFESPVNLDILHEGLNEFEFNVDVDTLIFNRINISGITWLRDIPTEPKK